MLYELTHPKPADWKAPLGCPARDPEMGYACEGLSGHDGPHYWNPDPIEWVDEAGGSA